MMRHRGTFLLVACVTLCAASARAQEPPPATGAPEAVEADIGGPLDGEPADSSSPPVAEDDSVQTITGVGGPAAPQAAPPQSQPEADGQGRDLPMRVGRLSYVEGAVSLRSGESAWLAATLNRPLTAGDAIYTDAGARAEVHVGGVSLRLGPKTYIAINALDDATLRLGLAEGAVSVHVRELEAGQQVEVDLPMGAAGLQAVGVYRVDVQGGVAHVIARRGRAEVVQGGAAIEVATGHGARLEGGEHTLADAAPGDAFDTWAAARDRREESPAALRYVSRNTVGYEDLDDHGDWSVSEEYGSVWVPRATPVGWAPYHFGHWAWVPPWGWTWIDDAPWGFAPFHYGRWAFWHEHWAWVPGPSVPRPCYAPALVAFVGGSAALGAQVTWFPLGPREVYVPGYHASGAYLRAVNGPGIGVTSVTRTNLGQPYVNRGVAGGVTSVTRQSFETARPVGVAAVTVPGGVHDGQVVGHAPPVPGRRGAQGVAAATARPPASVVGRPVTTLPGAPGQTRPLPPPVARPGGFPGAAPRPMAPSAQPPPRPMAPMPPPRPFVPAPRPFAPPAPHPFTPPRAMPPPAMRPMPMPHHGFGPGGMGRRPR